MTHGVMNVQTRPSLFAGRMVTSYTNTSDRRHSFNRFPGPLQYRRRRGSWKQFFFGVIEPPKVSLPLLTELAGHSGRDSWSKWSHP